MGKAKRYGNCQVDVPFMHFELQCNQLFFHYATMCFLRALFNMIRELNI